jgi:hypothetical protein
MLDLLCDDLLLKIADRLVRPDVEIDDSARSAAGLAMTSRRLSAVMSGVVWRSVAAAARRMHPDASAQAVTSHCATKTAEKRHLLPLATACGVPRPRSLKLWELEDALDKSDELVGAACPIPRAAAAYLLRMSYRWMTADVAAALHPDRDLDACQRDRSGRLRFRSLRSAPMKQAVQKEVPGHYLEATLDARFVGRPRPWWVRTHAAADLFFRREAVLALGFPVAAATRSAPLEHLGLFKSVCDFVGVNVAEYVSLSDGADARRGEWYRLRETIESEVPPVFSACRLIGPGMFGVEAVQYVRREVAAAFAEIADVPMDVQYATLEVMKTWWPAPFGVSIAVLAVKLQARGLPPEVAWWRIHVGYDDTNVFAIAAQAKAVSELLGVPVRGLVPDFATAVAAKCAHGPPANGWFPSVDEIVRATA